MEAVLASHLLAEQAGLILAAMVGDLAALVPKDILRPILAAAAGLADILEMAAMAADIFLMYPPQAAEGVVAAAADGITHQL